MTPTTATLDVPGATLYHEIRGSGGPVLLLIPGGGGDVAPFTAIGEALAGRYTVVAYERRGFSRSPLAKPLEPGDDEHRIATDAEDAHRLLAHLTTEPAYVFGSSSGAIVALELMTRHPDDVRLLLPHEPPLAALVSDGAELLALFDRVRDTHRAAGPESAMQEFLTGVFGEIPPMGNVEDRAAAMPPGMLERVQGNQAFWLEHELLPYPRYRVTEDALRAVADRIAPVCGRESRGQFPYRATMALAARLGRETAELPGGHIGYATDAADFAAAFAEVLARG